MQDTKNEITATALPVSLPRTGGDDVAAIASILGDPVGDQPGVGTGERRWRFPWKSLLMLGILAGAAAASPWVLAHIGPRGSANPLANIPSHTVERGELLISVTEDGSMVSDENVDVVCGVAGGATIVWLIEDGSRVTEGTELVRLDSSQLAENVSAQKIAYEKARAANIQADKDYSAARIAVEEYTEGTYKKELRKAESDVTAARSGCRPPGIRWGTASECSARATSRHSNSTPRSRRSSGPISISAPRRSPSMCSSGLVVRR